MPKIKVQATKMSDAKVEFISMVERGANRIPFKIIKQEKPMAGKTNPLDLGRLFAFKSEKKEPQVVGIVTMKGEKLEAVKKAVADAGFAVTDMVEQEDGSVIFKQDGATLDGETTLVRLSEDVALVTKEFRPYSMDMAVSEGTSFADAVAAQGFYPGMRNICDTMSSSIFSLVDSSATPADAAKNIAKLFDEAKAYAVSFVKGLPVKAFKLEATEIEVVKAETPEGDGGAADGESVEKGDKAKKPTSAEMAAMMAAEGKTMAEMMEHGVTEADAKAALAAGKKTKKDDESGEGAGDVAGQPEGGAVEKSEQSSEGASTGATDAAGAESAAPSLTADDVSVIVAKQVSDAMEALAKKFGEQVAGFSDEVKKSVAEVAGNVEDLSQRVSKAEAEAQKVSDTLAGTVVTGAEGGDKEPVVRKTETGGAFGGREIDTAFMGVPHRRRAGR